MYEIIALFIASKQNEELISNLISSIDFYLLMPN